MSTSIPSATFPATLIDAGLLRRLMCLVYEAFLLTALLFVAAFMFGALFHDAATGRIRPIFQAYLVAVMGFYFIWFWSKGRQTLAMKTWRLHIVNKNGHAIPVIQGVARFAVAFAGVIAAFAGYQWLGRWGLAFGGVNFLWALLDPERQFLHDRAAKTRVVTARVPEA